MTWQAPAPGAAAIRGGIRAASGGGTPAGVSAGGGEGDDGGRRAGGRAVPGEQRRGGRRACPAHAGPPQGGEAVPVAEHVAAELCEFLHAVRLQRPALLLGLPPPALDPQEPVVVRLVE